LAKSISIRNCWWFNFVASISKIISRNAGKPSAKELMQFVAVAGLAQNCSFTLFDNYWNSGRTYENAFEQHYQSV
jgi:hypothetical protein